MEPNLEEIAQPILVEIAVPVAINGDQSDDSEIDRLMADAHDRDDHIVHPGLQLLAADSSAYVSRQIFPTAKETGKIVFFKPLD